jgi:hypothetical protein
LQRYFILRRLSNLHPRNRLGEPNWAALPANDPLEKDEAGKPLALAGLHPYNPLTGIMLSRGISTGT